MGNNEEYRREDRNTVFAGIKLAIVLLILIFVVGMTQTCKRLMDHNGVVETTAVETTEGPRTRAPETTEGLKNDANVRVEE